MNLKGYHFFYYAVLALAAVGIAGALSIIPSKDEVAYLNFKDKNFKNALARYEEQYAAGNRSPSLIGTLCDLYLQYGQVNQAIEVLESNLSRLPDELEARNRLSRYYQYAQRPTDYLVNLEAISRIEPSKEILRQLSQIYNFNEQYDRQIDTLRRIIADFEPTHEDYIALAYLYAAQGRIEEAHQVVLEMFDKKFEQVGQTEIDFALSLMLDLNKKEEALNLAVRVIESKKGRQLERITNLFQSKGALPMAFKLLEPFEAQENLAPGILAALVSIQITQNRPLVALERLRRRMEAGTLPLGMVETYLDLILEYSNDAELERFIGQADLSLLDESHFLRIAKRLVRTENYAQAKRLKKRLTANYLKENWLVAAVLDVVANDFDSVAVSFQLNRNRYMEDWRRLFLARIYHELGLPELAKAQLEEVKQLSNVRHLDMAEVAEMFIHYDLAERAYALLESERRRVAGQELAFQMPVRLAWANVLAAMGRSQQVLDWVAQLEDPPLEIFRQLYFIGSRFQRRKMALLGARTLHQLEPSENSEAYLGHALVLNGLYEEALPLLKKLYARAHDDWLDAYAEALWALGQRDQWRQLWTDELKRDNLSETRRREIAFALLDKNFKADAETIFLEQAQAQGPMGQAVEQLIFLWGVRPSPEQVAWLKERAETAQGIEKAGWYRRLVEVGQGELLTQYVEDEAPWENAALIDVYLNHLSGQRDRTLFFSELSKAIEQESDQTRLKRLAQMAGNQPLAEAAFKKLLDLMPSDSGATAQLGITAYGQGKFSSAKTYLEEALSQGLVDADAFYYYAQLLQREDSLEKATKYFKQSLALLDVSGRSGLGVELMKAQIYWALDKREKTLAIYRAQIQAHPLQISLKADFANYLIEMGRIGEAEELIGVQ